MLSRNPSFRPLFLDRSAARRKTPTAVLTILCAAGLARAAGWYYVGPSSSNWNNAANWSLSSGGAGGAGVPGIGDDARLDNALSLPTTAVAFDLGYPDPGLGGLFLGGTSGQVTLTQSTNTVTIAHEAYIGFGNGGSGQYNLSGGTLTFTAQSPFPTLQVAAVAGSGGALVISNAATLTSLGNVEVGVADSTFGQMIQTGGTVTVGPNDPNNAKAMLIGFLPGSDGEYGMSTTTGASTLTIHGNLYVAAQGDADFGQSGGAVRVDAAGGTDYNLGGLYIAENGNTPGSNTGSYSMTGGTLDVYGFGIRVGGGASGPGGTGTFDINGGTVTCTNGVGTAELDAWGPGTVALHNGSFTSNFFNLRGGTCNMSGGTLTIAGGPLPNTTLYDAGAFNQTGGDVHVQGDATLEISQNGTWTISNGTVDTARFALGGSTGLEEAPGHLILNGGTFTVNTDTYLWPTSDIQFNGGTLVLNGLVHGNGNIVQTGGQSVFTSGTNLQQGSYGMSGGTGNTTGGGLDRSGSSGTLTIGRTTTFNNMPSVGNATFTQSGGALTVGVLGVGNDGVLTSGTGTGHFNASAGTLTADTILLGSSAGGSGDMTVSGTAAVTVGGGFSSNDLTMNGGSLTVLNQAPPAGEDPELNLSIVGGYLRDGTINMNTGTVTSPRIKLGLTNGNTGTMAMTGGTVNVGILAAGNDASLTTGSGTGHVTVSGGILNADTILLGSTAGGSGDMTVSNTAQVTVGGGFSTNDLTVNGGSFTVLDQNPPAGEDPVLNRSMVGGYLRDGAMFLSTGTVTTPKMKLGVTAAKTGSFTMTGGTATIGTLGVGNDATVSGGSGIGQTTVSAGTLNATTVLVGSSAGGTGTLALSGTGVLAASADIVNAGTMSLANSATLGAGGTISGNVLSCSGTPTLTRGTIAAPITTAASTSITKTTPGALTISGAQTYGASTLLNAQQGTTTFTSTTGTLAAPNLSVHATTAAVRFDGTGALDARSSTPRLFATQDLVLGTRASSTLVAGATSVLASRSISLDPTAFDAAANYTVGSSPTSVAVGDFNGDGKPDLAATNSGNDNVSIMLGNGGGSFQAPVNYGTGPAPLTVAVGDFNGDGKADLAVSNNNGDNVSVLLGNGNGTFQAAVNYATGVRPQAVAVGDFNGDGKPDLVTSNTTSNNVSILLGNGNGTFQAAVNYAAGTGPRATAVADFNGDGKADLAVANITSNNISILIGNGNGTFQPAVNYAVAPSPRIAAVGDFNGDGKTDLAVAVAESDSVAVLLGNGNGTFQAAVNYPAGSSPRGVVVADFNGDGKADLALGDSNGNVVSILRGNGNGTFQSPVAYAAGSQSRQLAAADLDGDGRPDIAVANISGGNISVLLNGAAARLDLNDNSYILDHSDPDHGAAASSQIASYITSGRNGGTWTGSGILSSVAASTPNRSVGMLNNDNGSGGSILSTFRGVSVDAGSILVNYTYTGDSNLDGAVDAADLNQWIQGYQGASLLRSGSASNPWYFGDYNYDGVIDLTDLALLAKTYSDQHNRNMQPLINAVNASGLTPAQKTQVNKTICHARGCAADFNDSCSVTVQDIFDFLTKWFAHDLAADYNHSGSVTVQDIFDFLRDWFTGCA